MNNNENESSLKLRKGLIVLIIMIAILVLFLLMSSVGIFDAVGVIIFSLQAVLFGIFFACLLSPVMHGMENLLRKKMSTPEKPRTDLIRALSILVAMALMIFIIVGVLLLVIPQLSLTLEKLIPSLRDMIDDFNVWIQGLNDGQFWQERIVPRVQEFTDNIASILLSNFGVGTEFYANLTGGIMSAFGVVMNSIIGLILSVYLLVEKDHIFAMIRKISIAIFKKKWGGYVMEAIDEGARIFSSFFGAKILEAIIYGVMNFIGMMLLQLPYATLISVIVGISNIIPFFGVYIGSVLGAAIIILVDPWQAVLFIILQVVVAQIDGNLIGPRILGQSTGLSAFWVIVAILLFNGCFGLIGAFLGVPFFGWVYYLVKRLTEHSLSKQNLPVDSAAYIEINAQLKEERKPAKKKRRRRRKSAHKNDQKNDQETDQKNDRKTQQKAEQKAEQKPVQEADKKPDQQTVQNADENK